jgi:hypothetical protein
VAVERGGVADPAIALLAAADLLNGALDVSLGLAVGGSHGPKVLVADLGQRLHLAEREIALGERASDRRSGQHQGKESYHNDSPLISVGR